MPDSHEHSAAAVQPSYKPVLVAIVALALLYVAAIALKLPIVTPHASAGAEHHAKSSEPPMVMVAPFVLLLAAIAVLPLVPRASHWWEHNLHKFSVAAGLGLATIAYYLLAQGGVKTAEVLDHAILKEFVPFIVLLFSLYTISGGIRIECDLPARPLVNATFLGAGAVLANFIGTTGAAMLLIRPLLETNSERKRVVHTVVFFIFVVCNCGGCLLPIGDPPLFLGYLKGVEFWWTLRLWPHWLAVNGGLIVVYVFWDSVFAYPRETQRDIARDERLVRPLRVSGWRLNGLLLLCIVASVALLDPEKPVPGTAWRPWPFLREVVQLLLVAASLALGPRTPRSANKFNFGAIIEVAVLFVGIFVCMAPAIELLKVEGPGLGINTAMKFFWCTGALSSVLDNAPTYAVFFETATSLGGKMPLVGGGTIDESLLTGISLGAVLMGSMTYIGNGPNFMVRTIAERSGVPMPSFFGYMIYSIAVLIPLFLAMTFAFFG
jgi:Na+/H+ antiporter NhaD/arsenite permease-like protein